VRAAGHNNFRMDGIDNTDQMYNGLTAVPPIDAIEEFQVVRNLYDAEYGRASGGSWTSSCGRHQHVPRQPLRISIATRRSMLATSFRPRKPPSLSPVWSCFRRADPQGAHLLLFNYELSAKPEAPPCAERAERARAERGLSRAGLRATRSRNLEGV